MKLISPILASVEGFELSDREKRLFEIHNPLGFCFFRRNIKSKNQLKNLIKQIKETMNRDDILFSIDQEGGRVRRLVEPEFRAYLPQSFLGDLYKTNPELAKSLAKTQSYLISQDFLELGMNLNLAPVLDVRMLNTSSALMSRCFSDDKETVLNLGQICIDEYNHNQIYSCMKHIPGHGKAYVDPHLQLPIINQSLLELENDFYPFKHIKNCPMAMTAHILIPDVDDKFPVTQSKKAIDRIIRGEIGFAGLLFSDAIDMKALKGSMVEKAITSLNAGCDAVCYAGGNSDELEDIFENTPKKEFILTKFSKINSPITNTENIDEYLKYSNNVELYKDEYDSTEVLNLMSKK